MILGVIASQITNFLKVTPSTDSYAGSLQPYYTREFVVSGSGVLYFEVLNTPDSGFETSYILNNSNEVFIYSGSLLYGGGYSASQYIPVSNGDTIKFYIGAYGTGVVILSFRETNQSGSLLYTGHYEQLY